MAIYGIKLGQRSMKQRSARRAVTAWLAVFALFVQAFAPLTAAWAFADQSGGLQVICTANGVQTIAVDLDGQPVNPQAQQASCPFCVLHVSAGVLTPSLSAVVTGDAEAQRTGFRPTSEDHASLWRAGPNPPRGPPAQS